MPSDREWMERAVDQARLSQGEPGRISPKVGAVVVNKDGEFLAQAHRGEDQEGRKRDGSVIGNMGKQKSRLT